MIGLQRTVISAAGGTPPDCVPLADLFAWGQVEEKPRPPSEAGAALLELTERELHEDFWLDGPWFGDLMSQSDGIKPPARLCLASKDAVLLAPYRVDQNRWGGFLIARPESSGRVAEFTCLSIQDGAADAEFTVNLRVPADDVNPKGFGSSKSDAILQIIRRENLS